MERDNVFIHESSISPLIQRLEAIQGFGIFSYT